MNYKEVVIRVSNDATMREKLIAALLEAGYDSFMEDDTSVSAYIETALFDEKTLRKVIIIFRDDAVIDKIQDLPDQNWNAVWESNYEPVVIDNQCVVRAPFHQKPENIIFDIIIQPKMSFGTAHHETTYLMLQMMLEDDFNEKQVLDMGSGTGILAIFAAMKGAQNIVAIDNDEWAFRNAVENAQLNDIRNIEFILGDAASVPDKKFDFILANINRNILLEDISKYNLHLTGHSIVYLSGFYENDLQMLKDEAGKYGWTLQEYRVRNQWVAARFQAGS
ncbi:MAG: 50S ribosomal protein L11 methyltransferase [Bacteroidales bacterium]